MCRKETIVYMSDLRDVIAKNIADLRNQKKITQFKLAQALNYSDKAVSKWERGESIPDVVVLKSIADYFGVTVDYLLCADHSNEQARTREFTRRQRRNRLIITSLSTALVWFIATLLFVILNIAAPGLTFRTWWLYIYAIPVSSIVILVFNSIWGRRKLNYLIISVLVWSLLLSVHLSFVGVVPLIWLVFILGIPAEVIIFFWSGLSMRRE